MAMLLDQLKICSAINDGLILTAGHMLWMLTERLIQQLQAVKMSFLCTGVHTDTAASNIVYHFKNVK